MVGEIHHMDKCIWTRLLINEFRGLIYKTIFHTDLIQFQNVHQLRFTPKFGLIKKTAHDMEKYFRSPHQVPFWVHVPFLVKLWSAAGFAKHADHAHSSWGTGLTNSAWLGWHKKQPNIFSSLHSGHKSVKECCSHNTASTIVNTETNLILQPDFSKDKFQIPLCTL